MAELLKGTSAADALTSELILRAEALKTNGLVPCLAILRVGNRADDLAYESGALKRCETVGIAVRQFILPADVSQNVLLQTIGEINRDAGIHGCLMFLPLPKHLDEKAACAALDPTKDIDGITPSSIAKLYSGSGIGFAPCTPQSCTELLNHFGITVSGKRVVVVGRSLVIGRPIALHLLTADGTVTICHSKTRDLQQITRTADIVIIAVGKAEAFGPEYFRPEQVVLDVGINWSEKKQKLVGDVDFDAVEPVVSAISPVPAGVGSLTAAVLCKHIIEAAENIGQQAG